MIRFEREFGLFQELEIQRLLQPLEGFFSTYYMLAFAPVVVSVLVWLAGARRSLYAELRTLLFVSLGIALVAYVAFPTAPPRLVPGLGIDDTVGLAGHDSGSFAGVRFDPYAAMPSLHVGWSALVGLCRLPRDLAPLAARGRRGASRADGARGDRDGQPLSRRFARRCARRRARARGGHVWRRTLAPHPAAPAGAHRRAA